MNIISENTFDALLNGVMEYIEMSRMPGMPIYIVRKTATSYERKHVICGINWGGYGTVDPESTRKFLEAMEKAVFITKTINAKEFTVKYDENPMDKEMFDITVDFVCNSLIADVKNIGKVIDILMNGGMA